MLNDIQKRFKRLLDELDEIGDEHGRMGFGILSTSPTTSLSEEEWQQIGSRIFENPYRLVPLVGRTFWVEPLPGRDACICYWSRKEGVESFKAGCKKAATILSRRQEALGGHFQGGGHRELLRELCALAVQEDVLSQLVKTRHVDVSNPTDPLSVRLSLPKRLKSPPTFDVCEVDDGPQAVAKILAQLLAIAPRSPGLSFDEDTGVWTINGTLEDGTQFHIGFDTKTGIVRCEGHPSWKSRVLKKEESDFLRVVLEAKGETRTGVEIFGNAYDSANITRIKKRLPAPLPKLIKGEPGRGNRLRTDLMK